MFSLQRCTRRGSLDWGGAIGLALLIGVVLVVVMPGRERTSPVRVGTSLFPLKVAGWLNTEDAESLTGGLASRLVVVDCWATWCPPCRAAMPKVARLHKRYAPLGVAFVGLTPESAGERMKIADYIATVEGFDWPVGYGSQSTLQRYGIPGYPTVILFGTDGRVIWSGVGHCLDELVVQLDRALLALPEE